MFKDLKLNRDNIEEVLKLYAKENYSKSSIREEIKNQFLTRFNIELDNKSFFIDFHFNNKGGTTIQIANGKETEEKEKIANYVKNHPLCYMASKEENNRSILFKNIDFEDFNEVINILKDDCENCKNIISEQSDDKKIIIKLEGRWSDKVTITYTISTKNVRVQGRPLLLYNEVSSYFNELIDIEDIVDNLEENFHQNIEKSTIEEQFKRYLPNSFDKHTEKLKKSLMKAVYNLNIDSHEYTCTELTFEALRAIEGHVKLTLSNDYKIRCRNQHGTLQMFSFDKNTNLGKLKEPERSIVGDLQKILYYEKVYEVIVKYRHRIFHWDYPDELGTDETVHIEEIDEAKAIIIKMLELIDEYYIL